MLEKIREALKKAGIDISHAEKLVSKVTDETKIDAAVAELKKEINAAMNPEQFKKFLDDNGFSAAMEKTVQSMFDSKITKALKTHEDTLREKGLLKADGDKKDEPKDKPKHSDNPEIAAMQAMIDKLTETITGQNATLTELTGHKKETDRKAKIAAALKKAEVSEAFADNVIGETDEQIEQSVNALKAKVQKVEQDRIDKELKERGLPLKSNGSKTTTEDEAAALAEAANKRDKENADGILKLVDAKES